MSVMMAAQPRMTPRSHRQLSLHLPLQCTEPFRHHPLKRLLDQDRLWTHHVHLRQHHPEENRPHLTEETTTLIATTRPVSHRLLSLARFLLPLHQSLRGSLNSQRTTAQMTCTRLLHHGDQSTVHRHHHLVRLVRLNNRHQCLQCHSQLPLHALRQDNLLMCHGLL